MDLKYMPPTIGLNLGEIVVDNIRLNFLDLGGQRELQHLWKKVREWGLKILISRFNVIV